MMIMVVVMMMMILNDNADGDEWGRSKCRLSTVCCFFGPPESEGTAFLHTKSFYTEQFLHKVYKGELLHTEALTHRSLLHTETCTQRGHYTEQFLRRKLFHGKAFTHNSGYTQTKHTRQEWIIWVIRQELIPETCRLDRKQRNQRCIFK